MPRGPLWQPFGWTVIGAALGGLVAALPFFAGADWPSWVPYVYFGTLLVFFAFGLLALKADQTTKGERAESLTALRDDYDRLLESLTPKESRSGPD